MHRPLFLSIIIVLFLSLAAKSQSADSLHLPQRGWNHSAAFEIAVPIGAFASSHLIGDGLEYAWSKHRFGSDVNPKKRFGFTAQGGFSLFYGKKEKVAGYPFHFGFYTSIHLLPGIIYNPYANVNLSLVAGPALSIYKGNSDVGMAAKFSANYWVTDRFSIGPGIMWRKEAGTESLLDLFARVAYTFRLKH